MQHIHANAEADPSPEAAAEPDAAAEPQPEADPDAGWTLTVFDLHYLLVIRRHNVLELKDSTVYIEVS